MHGRMQTITVPYRVVSFAGGKFSVLHVAASSAMALASSVLLSDLSTTEVNVH